MRWSRPRAAAWGVALAVLVAGGLLLARRNAPPPNLLVITLDTLRADRLGSYGYGAARTPRLDGLAARGLRFSQATTVTPLTLPAHSSLFTATFPPFHGVRDNGGFYLGDDQVTLAETLRERGYRTGGFVSSFVLDSRWGIHQGFDRYFDEFDLAKFDNAAGMDAIQRPGGETVDEALRWLGEDRARPFFAWVHLYDPHAPYRPARGVRRAVPGHRLRCLRRGDRVHRRPGGTPSRRPRRGRTPGAHGGRGAGRPRRDAGRARRGDPRLLHL